MIDVRIIVSTATGGTKSPTTTAAGPPLPKAPPSEASQPALTAASCPPSPQPPRSEYVRQKEQGQAS
jgi:hypothetical protein